MIFAGITTLILISILDQRFGLWLPFNLKVTSDIGQYHHHLSTLLLSSCTLTCGFPKSRAVAGKIKLYHQFAVKITILFLAKITSLISRSPMWP